MLKYLELFLGLHWEAKTLPAGPQLALREEVSRSQFRGGGTVTVFQKRART